MNNVAFVESSRMLAEQMVRGADEVSGRIDLGFQLLLGRAASGLEIVRLSADYEAFRSGFDVASAVELLEIGDKPRDPKLDPIELAATTLIASTLLNLDETLTRE